jgi:hypothetical protein
MVLGSTWQAFSKYKQSAQVKKNWDRFHLTEKPHANNKEVALSMSSILKPTFSLEQEKIDRDKVFILRKVAFNKGDKGEKKVERKRR